MLVCAGIIELWDCWTLVHYILHYSFRFVIQYNTKSQTQIIAPVFTLMTNENDTGNKNRQFSEAEIHSEELLLRIDICLTLSIWCGNFYENHFKIFKEK